MKRILILAVSAVFAFGCSRSEEVKNTATVNAPPANTATNAAPPPVKEEVYTAGANPRADLISATQKLQKVPFWSAVVTSASDLELKIEMEYAAPDRYRIKKAEGEVIVIGGDTYSNEGGKWEKIDSDIGALIKEQISTGIAEGVQSMKDVQIAGKEKFAGKDATVYAHKIGDAQIKVWIATDTGLQLKNEVELSAAGEVQKQTTVYDYEKPVKIEAPKITQ
ncbi:MAG TPA: hypothetical protein VIL74_07390 [Pyrinomonadaceae bacterium]|jgi:hypothetical protein